MINQQTGAPTMTQYSTFNQAFDFLNGALFAGELPKVLVTFSRKNRMLGFFSPDRWESSINPEDRAGEISFNPDSFIDRSPEEVLSTLVHEMVHSYQHHFGKPSRAGYHNVEWGTKMVEIGLMPSNTGKEGGGKTGQQMTHYILDDGPFALAAADLLALGWGIAYCGQGRTFHGGSWTWTGWQVTRVTKRPGDSEATDAGQVCLPRMQGRCMGQTRAEYHMRGLPRAHGLSPERHTQRRNAGWVSYYPPGVSFALDHHHLAQLRPRLEPSLSSAANMLFHLARRGLLRLAKVTQKRSFTRWFAGGLPVGCPSSMATRLA